MILAVMIGAGLVAGILAGRAIWPEPRKYRGPDMLARGRVVRSVDPIMAEPEPVDPWRHVPVRDLRPLR